MQFVNAVVSTPADDIDFKIHLRNEFMRCGLGQVLPVKFVLLFMHLCISLCKIKLDFARDSTQRLVDTSGDLSQ